MNRIVSMVVLVLLVAACPAQEPTHQIEQTDTGYVVAALPDEILEGFPQEHRIKLTLQDGERTAAVTGLASISEGVLAIATDETLTFMSASVDAYLLLQSVEGTVAADAWSGCPANPALKVYRDNPKTCWCWSDGVAVTVVPDTIG